MEIISSTKENCRGYLIIISIVSNSNWACSLIEDTACGIAERWIGFRIAVIMYFEISWSLKKDLVLNVVLDDVYLRWYDYE